MALALNAGDFDFEARSQTEDFIFVCGRPGAKFGIPDHPWAYSAPMGICKGGKAAGEYY